MSYYDDFVEPNAFFEPNAPISRGSKPKPKTLQEQLTQADLDWLEKQKNNTTFTKSEIDWMAMKVPTEKKKQ